MNFPLSFKIITILLIFLPIKLFANDVLSINDVTQEYSLGKYISVLEDPSGQLTINDVTKNRYTNQYKHHSSDSVQLGFSNSTYWIRLKIKNNSTLNGWSLIQWYVNSHYFDLYIPTDNAQNYQVLYSGNLRPQNDSTKTHRLTHFKLSLDNNKTRTYYLRYKSQAAISIQLQLLTSERYTEIIQTTNYGLGFFYGLLSVLIVFNSMLYLLLRQKIFLYLALFITNILIAFLSYDGFIKLIQSNEFSSTTRHIIPLFLSFSLITLFFYSHELTSREQPNKPFQQSYRYFIIAWLALIISEFVFDYLITIIAMIPLLLATLLYLFVEGLKQWKKYNSSTRFIVLGFLVLFTGFFIFILMRLNFINSNVVFEQSIRISVVIFILFMSLAVVDYIQHLQDSKKIFIKNLSITEDKFRAIFDETFQLRGVLSPDGILLEANKTALSFGNYGPEDVIGLHFWKTPWWKENIEQQNLLHDAVKQAATGKTVRLELVLPSYDGIESWMDFSLKPFKDNNGNITMLLPEGWDISDRKRAEQAITDIATGMLENTGDSFFEYVVKQSAKLLNVNTVFIGLINEHDNKQVDTLKVWHNGEIVNNMSYSIINSPCENIINKDTCSYPNNLQQLFPLDTLLVKLNANSYYGIPLIDPDGKHIGLLVALNDTTIQHSEQIDKITQIYAARCSTEIEKIQAQHEIEQHRNNLEQLVQSRTSELELINNELESFSYSVSHDLRAPLRAIIGFSEIILEDYNSALDKAGQDLLARVIDNSLRMSHLIDDLLELSRIGRQKLDTKTVNLDKLVNVVIKSLTEHEPDRIVEFNCEPLGNLTADPGLLKIVFDNLIENAWKYSSKKENAFIEIGKQTINRENVFFIKDNGAGFDMEYATKIFAPFQRLHQTDEFEGTGIGLATVYRIIARHSGKIWVDSIKNQGTTFYFIL